MKNNEDQNPNLINATDEQVDRLNKILAKQLRTKMVYTILGGVAVAVVSGTIKFALNRIEIDHYVDLMKDLTPETEPTL